MKKLVIITSGFLPVPATKGGAVENLIVNYLNENEKNNNLCITVISVFDSDAQKCSNKYHNSNFKFVKINPIVRLIDKISFFVAKTILKKADSHKYRYIFQRLYYLNKCSIILKKENYDIVLLENHPSQYLALKWRKNYIKYKNKYYYHCHNEFPSKYDCYDIIKNTKKFICVSKFRKNNIKEYLNLEDDKFCVLKNVIDDSVINKRSSLKKLNALRMKYNIGKNDKILLYTGRIVPGKGIKEILCSIKNLTLDNYKLLVLGSSLNELSVKTNFELELINLIDQTIKNKVIFTGFINYNELYNYYNLADIVLLPSIIDDSAPLTIIEAMCCAKPIITTDSGGIPEYAANNSAIILKRDNHLVDNLTKNIDLLLNDNNLLLNLSNKAKNESKNWTIKKYYDLFNEYMDIN